MISEASSLPCPVKRYCEDRPLRSSAMSLQGCVVRTIELALCCERFRKMNGDIEDELGDECAGDVSRSSPLQEHTAKSTLSSVIYCIDTTNQEKSDRF